MSTQMMEVGQASAIVGAALARLEDYRAGVAEAHAARAQALTKVRADVASHVTRLSAPGTWVDDLVLLPAATLPALVPRIVALPGWTQAVAREIDEAAQTLRHPPVQRRLGRSSLTSGWAEAAQWAIELDRWLLARGGTFQGVHAGGGEVDVLAEALGIASTRGAAVLSHLDAETLAAAARGAAGLADLRERHVAAVSKCHRRLQDSSVQRRLAEIDVEALAQASGGAVRAGVLRSSGMGTVRDVLARGRVEDLMAVRGLSPDGARQALATGNRLREAVRADLGGFVTLAEDNETATALVGSLRAILACDEVTHAHADELAELVRTCGPVMSALAGKGDTALFHVHSPRRAPDLVRHLTDRAAWLRTSGLALLLRDPEAAMKGVGGSVWADYRGRIATYRSLLAELTGTPVEEDAAQGHLPTQIAEAVSRVTLDHTALTASLRSSLRGYQEFGAKFAVARRRVLLGDEMGLGKTVQALTVMSTLHAQGESRFLVVCPPAVLMNWLKETRRFTAFETHRLHGAEKSNALKAWRRRGGVAVTTFQTLVGLGLRDETALLVVDEAHLVKNPMAQQTQAVAALAVCAGRVLFLSGTPLENRVEDFTNLVRMLQPDIVGQLRPEEMMISAKAFRTAMAPVYLRRNAAEVLKDLPPISVMEDWTSFNRAEEAAYAAATQERDFHLMRRVGMTANPHGSEKMARLVEIVEEAAANRRNVLVFSFYREVVSAVAEVLGDRVVGVITGSTPPADREQLVEELGRSPRPGVLIGQIDAAGTGMNIQAASVVVMCEPQLKPTTEAQAIKRTHRPGQDQHVSVHRLFTSGAVDERLRDLLETKAELIEELVNRSELTDASPDAVDVSEKRLIDRVLAAESERLRALIAKQPRRERGGATVPTSGAAGDSPVWRPVKRNAEAKMEPVRQPRARPQPTAPASDREVSRAEQSRSRSASAKPSLSVDVCGSCDRPISVLGHCGCS